MRLDRSTAAPLINHGLWAVECTYSFACDMPLGCFSRSSLGNDDSYISAIKIR